MGLSWRLYKQSDVSGLFLTVVDFVFLCSGMTECFWQNDPADLMATGCGLKTAPALDTVRYKARHFCVTTAINWPP